VGVYHERKNALRFLTGYPLSDVVRTLYGKLYTYEYTMRSSTWRPIASRPDEHTLYQSAAATNISNFAVVHGGFTPDSLTKCINGKIEVLDLDCNKWYQLENSPVPRKGHKFLIRGNNLVIFGGNDGRLLNDVTSIPLNINFDQNRNLCIGMFH
jgi:hypothetical protein